MGQKQCGKCGEMVDEAKAFCPGCGHAFVEEKKRDSVSDYDLSQQTVKLGDTMYNQMLSDMGLSVSKTPKREKSVEVLAPASTTDPSTREKKVEPVQKGSNTKWIILAVIAVGLVLLLLLILIAAVLLFFYR